VIRNFISKEEDWKRNAPRSIGPSFVSSLPRGGLGLIDPNAQFEALLVKLLIRRLSPRTKSWKKLLKDKTKHVQPVGRFFAPWPSDINWLFGVVKP
jgi:hypothetical protein